MAAMNRDLFWKLLETEHAKAEAFCRRLTNNVDEGDDLYQDCLIKAYHKFESLRQRNSFRPWLYRIIVNTFKSGKRAPWWSRRANYDDIQADGHVTYDQISELDTRRILNRLLATLSPGDRALVVLFELEGWSIVELSRMLGKSEGTIKSKLSRARQKMRKELAKSYLSTAKIKIEEGGKICVVGKSGIK